MTCGEVGRPQLASLVLYESVDRSTNKFADRSTDRLRVKGHEGLGWGGEQRARPAGQKVAVRNVQSRPPHRFLNEAARLEFVHPRGNRRRIPYPSAVASMRHCAAESAGAQ